MKLTATTPRGYFFRHTKHGYAAVTVTLFSKTWNGKDCLKVEWSKTVDAAEDKRDRYLKNSGKVYKSTAWTPPLLAKHPEIEYSEVYPVDQIPQTLIDAITNPGTVAGSNNKTATVRTYYRKGEAQERFQCPYCGCKQETHESSGTEEWTETCCNCNQSIKLIYRRIHRKTY
jgi:hypothetical protein